MLILLTRNSLTTDVKYKLREFNTLYALNRKYDGRAILFVILKMVHPDTCAVSSDINTELDTMKMSHFKQDYPKANLHIVEWMINISISGEIYS